MWYVTEFWDLEVVKTEANFGDALRYAVKSTQMELGADTPITIEYTRDEDSMVCIKLNDCFLVSSYVITCGPVIDLSDIPW